MDCFKKRQVYHGSMATRVFIEGSCIEELSLIQGVFVRRTCIRIDTRRCSHVITPPCSHRTPRRVPADPHEPEPLCSPANRLYEATLTARSCSPCIPPCG